MVSGLDFLVSGVLRGSGFWFSSVLEGSGVLCGSGFWFRFRSVGGGVWILVFKNFGVSGFLVFRSGGDGQSDICDIDRCL